MDTLMQPSMITCTAVWYGTLRSSPLYVARTDVMERISLSLLSLLAISSSKLCFLLRSMIQPYVFYYKFCASPYSCTRIV